MLRKMVLGLGLAAAFMLVGGASYAEGEKKPSPPKSVDDSSRPCQKRCVAWNDKGVCTSWSSC
jgi:hypothetical protein